MIVINHPEAWRKIAAACKASYAPALDVCIARLNDGTQEVLGGAMLCDYTGKGGSAMCHMAGLTQTWLSRRLLWAYFDFAFNKLEVGKLIAIVPGYNEKALRLDRHFGFVDETTISGVFTFEGDIYPAIVLSMTREQCRFLTPPKGVLHG